MPTSRSVRSGVPLEGDDTRLEKCKELPSIKEFHVGAGRCAPDGPLNGGGGGGGDDEEYEDESAASTTTVGSSVDPPPIIHGDGSCFEADKLGNGDPRDAAFGFCFAFELLESPALLCGLRTMCRMGLAPGRSSTAAAAGLPDEDEADSAAAVMGGGGFCAIRRSSCTASVRTVRRQALETPRRRDSVAKRSASTRFTPSRDRLAARRTAAAKFDVTSTPLVAGGSVVLFLRPPRS